MAHISNDSPCDTCLNQEAVWQQSIFGIQHPFGSKGDPVHFLQALPFISEQAVLIFHSACHTGLLGTWVSLTIPYTHNGE